MNEVLKSAEAILGQKKKQIEVPIAPELQEDYGITEIVTEITMGDLKKSKEVYFRLSPTAKKVYESNGYDRGSKTYSISPVDDYNKESFVKKTRKIYVGFTF